MKLSVCLLFLGCLVLVAEAMSEPREEDLQGLLTELEDLVDELEVAEWERLKSECRVNAVITVPYHGLNSTTVPRARNTNCRRRPSQPEVGSRRLRLVQVTANELQKLRTRRLKQKTFNSFIRYKDMEPPGANLSEKAGGHVTNINQPVTVG
ncbi:hypothetical protein Bbelb_361500 [Branchiostoma belcheri]|nr:hypothetical protein Bbelb_361500 [Branchiostoma belcheri]